MQHDVTEPAIKAHEDHKHTKQSLKLKKAEHAALTRSGLAAKRWRTKYSVACSHAFKESRVLRSSRCSKATRQAGLSIHYDPGATTARGKKVEKRAKKTSLATS